MRKMATKLMRMMLDRQQVKMVKKRMSLPPQLKSIRESEEKEVDSWNERGQLSGRLTQSSSWEATAQSTNEKSENEMRIKEKKKLRVSGTLAKRK